MAKQTQSYKAQIDLVLHHINCLIIKDWSDRDIREYNKKLKITSLANIAAMSPHNFQSRFEEYLGETVHQYIIRLRLEQAQNLLKEGKLTNTQISDFIAFANSPAFNNTFKKKYKETPKQIQDKLQRNSIIEDCFDLQYKEEMMPEMNILYLQHIGDYDILNTDSFEKESWDTLYEYAQSNHLLSEEEKYIGICFDDTDITSIDKCRFYAGLSITSELKLPLNSPIKYMTIPTGKYAIYKHKGCYTKLKSFYNAILSNPQHNLKLGHGFIIEQYLNSPSNTEEDELLTDIIFPML